MLTADAELVAAKKAVATTPINEVSFMFVPRYALHAATQLLRSNVRDSIYDARTLHNLSVTQFRK